jgi:hypothetical protein
MLQDLIDSGENLKKIQDSENIWENGKLKAFNHLCIDYSGKAGETGLYNFLLRTKKLGLHNWEIIYKGDSNINQKNGTYDMVIVLNEDFNLGIKTSRIGKNKTFQHDGLHNNECDGELFIDITPNFVYLTIIPFLNYSLFEKHPIFGVKPHLRKNTNNNFKFDLNEKKLQKGIKNKMTIIVDDETKDGDIISFFENFLK